MSALAGLLLAGGGSVRFGSDKAMAVVDGMTLLERAAACLREACDGPVLVASGDGVRRPDVLDGQVADLVPDGGPLAGIAAGLLALRARGHDGDVAVLAVDHLQPSVALLRHLALGAAGSVACSMARVDGRDQPLHAVWQTDVADDLADAVRGGQRSVLGWLRGQTVRVATDATLVAAGIDLRAVRDVDSPEDLPGGPPGELRGP